MKRIRLATNRFLSLYRTQTDAGLPIAFELCRDQTYRFVPIIAIFKKDQEFAARQAWEVCSDALSTISPMLSNKKLKIIIDRSAALAARTAPLLPAEKPKPTKRRMTSH